MALRNILIKCFLSLRESSRGTSDYSIVDRTGLFARYPPASFNMDPNASIPSPLPALLQLLPFLLAESPCPIPASLLSDPVVQRHYYMSSKADSPEYLQGHFADAETTENLHQLAAQGVENVAPTKDIKYTAAYDEENRLIARIRIAGWTGKKHALYLWLMWEEASSSKGSDASSNGQLESAWRFYDIKAPSHCTGDPQIWKDTIQQTLADVAEVKRFAAEQQEELEDEDEEKAAARYWGGVSDNDNEAQQSPASRLQTMSVDSEDDDAYWSEYGKQKSTIGGEARLSSNGDNGARPSAASSAQSAMRKSAPSSCGNADAATIQALQGVWNLYRQLNASHHHDEEESRAAFLELARQAASE